MKSSVIILLLLLFCGVTVSPFRVYRFVSKEMDWYEAQKYCRQMKMDLATISSPTEQNRLQWDKGNSRGWIGLKRTGPVSNTWQWSDGNIPTFFQWAITKNPNYEQNATQYQRVYWSQEDEGGDDETSVYWTEEYEVENEPPKHETPDDCVILTGEGWSTSDCSRRWPFFCYKNMTVVKENKTWEQALEYCRTRNTALASLHWNSQLADKEAAEAQTGSVWMGLRFINGRWLWVSGKEARHVSLIAKCPAPRYRCGARNGNRRAWENRDCSEKLNFLCY